MASEHLKVLVAVQDRSRGTYGYSGDQTVNQPSNSLALASAAAIECCGIFVVARQCLDMYRPSKQASKARQMRFVSSPSKDFHAHGIADRHFFGKYFIDEDACRRVRVTQELYPCGGIYQDHGERPERIASRSPSQPMPRSARASSRVAGSAARVRRAKLIASLLVERR